MGSAHSVSLQIYVFPFTCFAFSLFFCHFVSPSPFLLPSRAPHCAASSRSVSPWSTRGDRRSVSVADKRLAPRSMWPLAGGACILLTRMSTSERRVGEGRFFFVSPSCLLFPLFYFAWRCAQPLRATAQEGCWHFVCSISWTHRPFDEASNDAGAGNERGVGATAENTGATARKRGAFRTALLVRLREASTSRVVEPCRRRAQEEVERHGRERDKCRAKT